MKGSRHYQSYTWLISAYFLSSNCLAYALAIMKATSQILMHNTASPIWNGLTFSPLDSLLNSLDGHYAFFWRQKEVVTGELGTAEQKTLKMTVSESANKYVYCRHASDPLVIGADP